jgi:hypothetical protein
MAFLLCEKLSLNVIKRTYCPVSLPWKSIRFISPPYSIHPHGFVDEQVKRGLQSCTTVPRFL